MSSIKSRITNRRKALRDLTGLGAIAGMLPLLGRFRSEEHTSDSSHGYISYAVFCLKKKIWL